MAAVHDSWAAASYRHNGTESIRVGPLMRAIHIAVFLSVAVASTRAPASPTLPFDDPTYDRLAVLRALGQLPLYAGGIRPITEYDAEQLLLRAGDAPGPLLTPIGPYGLWVHPAHRLGVRVGLFSDEDRPYSTPDRPVGMVGGVSVSCEHQEGRPCGSGGGVLFEIDSAAGWRHYVSAFTRLQVISGSDKWSTGGALDRAYVNAEVGPAALLVGRDVVALGPGGHTQLIWGDNPAPFDHVRLQTSHPLKIPRIPVTISAFYAVGRLRDPQTFHNTMVTLGRLEVAVFDQLQLGVQQLLQLDGEGAIHYDFWDFIAEHFTRTGNFGMSAGGSNRRASLDATYTNKWARGLRLYYELAFEDFRTHVVDMFLYDCDHLLGAQMAALTRSGRHGFLVELQHNGPYSQQHSYFTTGMTNQGRVVGAPLGPDSWSLYLSARIDLPRRMTLWPWIEWARLASDHYNEIYQGPILVTSKGPAESRWRIGARARFVLRPDLRVEASALYEHVDTFAFTPGTMRDNGGVSASLVWFPPR